MKESNDNSLKISNYWKKTLYSSIVLGVIFAGGQYMNSVHTNADVTQNSKQKDTSQLRFYDQDNQMDISAYNVNVGVGQSYDLKNTKVMLQDDGYDVSNVPDIYTPINADPITCQVRRISAVNEPTNINNKTYRYIFEVVDQYGNYIESKYGSSDTYAGFDTTPLIEELQQEQDKFLIIPSNFDNGKLLMTTFGEGDNINTIRVTAPNHVLTTNYVNQDGVTVFRSISRVTDYGHTFFYDNQNFSERNLGIKVNPGQEEYVSNTQSTATVHVTTDPSFQVPSDPSKVILDDEGYPFPDISTLSDANGNPDPYEDTYYTPLNIVGADGKTILSLILGSDINPSVSTGYLDSDESDYDEYINFNNVTDMPSVIDLTKGPYTFHSTDTLSGLQASSAAAKSQAAAEQQASSSAQSSQSNQPQQAAPQSSASQPAVESAKSSEVVSSASQPSIESAKSSAQPSSVPAEQPAAPAVQSHSSAAPVVSTAKSTPAPETKKKPAPAPKPVVKPAPRPAKPVVKAKTENGKPTKAQLKTITKTYKQSEHAVKTDTAKLKSLKKKMKKHATKEQKTTYKKLQTKLDIEKKSLKSVKVQEEKVTKYFKEVSTINHDNKQIKSLTAQLKKLKKKHSKANKKKAAKVQKALKKANNSLKEATKFVKNYK